MNVMNYKGFRASVSYDDTRDTFVGKVLSAETGLLFSSNSVEGLKKAFRDKIDSYLDKGQAVPIKKYNGTFNIRISPELHKKLALEAEKKSISINKLINEILTSYVNSMKLFEK